jgi:hypothetical protein
VEELSGAAAQENGMPAVRPLLLQALQAK